MGLVYVYLLTWVLGGVILGLSMLLEHRDDAPVTTDNGEPPRATTPPIGSGSSVAMYALIGFGMFGLVAEGLGVVSASYTPLVAVLGAAILAGAGYVLHDRLQA